MDRDATVVTIEEIRRACEIVKCDFVTKKPYVKGFTTKEDYERNQVLSIFKHTDDGTKMLARYQYIGNGKWQRIDN